MLDETPQRLITRLRQEVGIPVPGGIYRPIGDGRWVGFHYDEMVLNELSNDYRMKNVWRELSRLSDEIGVQYLKDIMNVKHEVELARRSLEVETQAVQKAHEALPAIKELLRIPKNLLPFKCWDEACEGLEYVKGYFEKIATGKWLDEARGESSRKLMASPHTELLRRLSEATKRAFGKPRDTIVSIVASVVLDADIDPKAVESARRKKKPPIRP